MIRPTRALALAAAVATTIGLAACGGESDSQRRPIGQQRASPGSQLPEGHPEIPPGGADGAGGMGGMSSGASNLPPAVQARLDSGNTAYRAGEYQEALRHYRVATGDSAGGEAAWFGVYMAQQALGNEAAADSALRRAGELGESPSFHPSPSDTTGAGTAGGGTTTGG